MKLPFPRIAIRIFAVGFATSLAFVAVCRAQGTSPNLQTSKEQQQDQDQQMKQQQLSKGPDQQAPKVDPKEEAAYKAFFDTGAQDADKRIQLGQDFVQKYPSSVYIEAVHSGVAKAYYSKEDWKDFYAEADKALALKPDDVDLLTMVGWVIPHMINGSEPDAGKQLDKAETYEKHAIEIIGTLPKPANVTDEQFTTLKNEKLAEAHSGLGLVYFRRQNFDSSVKELQQAIQGTPSPDPTDLFVLGAGLQNSGHFNEAFDAFNHCSQIMGSLQAQCKQNADNAKKLAAQQK